MPKRARSPDRRSGHHVPKVTAIRTGVQHFEHLLPVDDSPRIVGVMIAIAFRLPGGRCAAVLLS